MEVRLTSFANIIGAGFGGSVLEEARKGRRLLALVDPFPSGLLANDITLRGQPCAERLDHRPSRLQPLGADSDFAGQEVTQERRESTDEIHGWGQTAKSPIRPSWRVVLPAQAFGPVITVQVEIEEIDDLSVLDVAFQTETGFLISQELREELLEHVVRFGEVHRHLGLGYMHQAQYIRFEDREQEFTKCAE